MLSRVAGLNSRKALGMQVSGSGELPVCGSGAENGREYPEGEMEAYKAAGLEKWLEGKGR